MTRKILPLLLGGMMILTLAGCGNQPVSEQAEEQNTAVQTEPQESTEAETESESQPAESNAEESESVSSAPTEKESTEPAETEDLSTETKATEPSGQETPDSQAARGQAEATETASAPTTETESDTQQAVESEPPVKPTEAVSTAEPEPSAQPEESEPEPEPEDSAFDIDHWIAYAKSYAEGIGLGLNSEAVYCWDNPITAGSHCLYLERDIKNRLDRYGKDGDITEVWIWAEPRGDGSYDLYIGYA